MSPVEKHLGPTGFCLGSKTWYIISHPKNVVVFNATVCALGQIIWTGDIDVTEAYANLAGLAKDLGETVWVLPESSRFVDAINFERFVFRVSPKGEVGYPYSVTQVDEKFLLRDF